MVGHSLGGPYMMTYTKYHGAEVAGLVFVDASHPDQVARLASITGKAAERPLALLGVAAKLSWTGLVRVLSGQLQFPALPDQRPVEAMRAYLPRSLGQEMLEMASLDSTFAEAGTFRELGDRPIVVLTAMAPMDSASLAALGMTKEQGAAFKVEWNALQTEEAGWSTNSRHEVFPDATHYIQMDRPDAVIRAVRDVVEAVRTSGSVARD
jgi:pimeloyl-ACP methyl ester carboxylesterase